MDRQHAVRFLPVAVAVLVVAPFLLSMPALANVVFSDNFDDGKDNGWLRSDAAPFYSVVDGQYRINNWGGGVTFSTRPDVTVPARWTYEADIRAWRPDGGAAAYGGLALVSDVGNPWGNYLLVNVCVHETQSLVGLQIHWQTGATSIRWVPYTQGDLIHLTVTRGEGSNVLVATLAAPGGSLTESSIELGTKLSACTKPGIQVAGGANATFTFDDLSIATGGVSGVFLSVDGIHGVLKYASGFGDDHNIPSRTSIDFTGAIADDADKYLGDAESLGSWQRSGTVLGAFSTDPENAIVYRIDRPEPVAAGYSFQSCDIYLGTRIFQGGGRVSLYVSGDGVNWSPPLQTDQNTADGWQTRFHDISVPPEYIGPDTVYVKLTGNCPAGNDWASVEDWGIVLTLETDSRPSAVADMRWAAMDLGGIPGSPVYQGNSYRDAYTLLSAIGVEGVNRSADWWGVERVNGYFSWNTVGGDGDPLDDSARYAHNAGLQWMPQISVHYRPFWMQGVKGATTPFDWIYPDGTTDKTHGQWSPPNFFFPGNSTWKPSSFYTQRYIERFGEHFAAEKPPLIAVSDGTFGEAYYGVDSGVNPVSDPYTLAAWQAERPSSAIYSSPDLLCEGTADQQAFGRWWNGKLVDDHIANVHAWGAAAFPDTGQLLKCAVHGGMCQDQNAQMQAALPSNLEVCSFGGPLRAGFASVPSNAHNTGVAAWVESFIDENHTVGDAIRYLNQDYWDCYNQAGIFMLFGAYAEPTAALEQYSWLINASRGVLVSDGSFEAGAASWTIDSPQTASWGVSTSYAVVGASSVRVTSGAAAIGSIRSSPIPVAPGMEYAVGCFVRGGASNPCSVVVREYNSSGSQVGESSTPPAVALGWRYVYLPFVTTAQTSTIRISLRCGAASRDAYFDYVTLRGASLNNPGFESGTSGWAMESGTGWGISSSGAHTGSGCAYLAGGSTSTVLVSSSVTVMGVRHRYWVSGWARTTGGGRVMLAVREYSAAGQMLKVTGYTCAPGENWQYLLHSFTPTSRAASFRICFYYFGSGGTAFVDDVGFHLSAIWNAGFERGNGGVPDGWSALGAPVAWGQTNIADGNAPEAACTEGQHGLFVDGALPGSGATSMLRVTPGRSYRVGCFARGSAVALRISQYSQSGELLSSKESGRADTRGKFQYVERMFTAQAGAVRADVSLVSYSPLRACFDDVRVDALNMDSSLGTIHGVITDASTGTPVAGAEIAAPGGASALSGPDGTYSLDREPGHYTLSVLREGYIAARSTPLELASGGSINQPVRLIRFAPVLGAPFADRFSRPDSPSLGTTETGGLTWESSNCRIEGGSVRMSGPASFWLRNVAPDKLDITFRVKLNASDPTSWVGLAYRERRLNDITGQNYLLYITPDGNVRLFYEYGAIASATVPVAGWTGFHTIRVRAVASSHKVWWDSTGDQDAPVLNVVHTKNMAPGYAEFCFSGVGEADHALVDDIASAALPAPVLTQDHLNLNGETGVYKYASGFGDDRIIPGHTAIDFSGAIYDNFDKYLSDAFSLGSWYRNGTQLGSFSRDAANSIIYRIDLPAEGAQGYIITAGQIMVMTRLYEQTARVLLYVSRDGASWSTPLLAEQKAPPNSWEIRSHDVLIPAEFVGGDTIYVKIVGSCPSANDWASIEDWGIRLELRAVSGAVPVSRLADLDALGDGTAVRVLAPMAVTMGWGTLVDGTCYVEEPGRSRGIKVSGDTGLAIGDAVTFEGVLTTDARGEPMISIASVKSRVPGTPVRPLGMSNRSAGSSMADALLVTVWGRVSTVAPDRSFVCLDDGSAAADASGHVGIRITLGDRALPVATSFVEGDFAAVTGVAGLAKDGGVTVRTIRPRGDSDIVVF